MDIRGYLEREYPESIWSEVPIAEVPCTLFGPAGSGWFAGPTKSTYFSFYEPVHDAVITKLMDKMSDLEQKMQGQILYYQLGFIETDGGILVSIRGELRYWEAEIDSLDVTLRIWYNGI